MSVMIVIMIFLFALITHEGNSAPAIWLIVRYSSYVLLPQHHKDMFTKLAPAAAGKKSFLSSAALCQPNASKK
jgi:hypothetical protein